MLYLGLSDILLAVLPAVQRAVVDGVLTMDARFPADDARFVLTLRHE